MLVALNGGVAFIIGYTGASMFWIIIPAMLMIPAFYKVSAVQNGNSENGAWSMYLIRDLQQGRRLYFLVKIFFAFLSMFISYWVGAVVS